MNNETKKYLETKADNANKRRKDKKRQKEHDRNVIWEVFIRDLKRIITNPILTIMMIAILAFPSLYAWCGIGANWDPYANASNMPVCVVIEDQPAQSSLIGEVNLGDTLKETLENNRALDWDFCDYDEAMNKVDWGIAYAAFVIPNDFSQSFCNIFEGENLRDYVNFDIYVNERQNAASVKVSDTGATTIETQINSIFRGIVSGVVAQKISDITDGAVQGSRNIATTLSQRLSMVAQTVLGFTDVLDAAGNTVEATSQTMSSVKQTLTDIQTQMDQVTSTLELSRQSITRARENIAIVIKELKEKAPSLEIVIEVFEQLEKSLDNAAYIVDKTSATISELRGTVVSISSTLDVALNVFLKTGALNENLNATLVNINEQLNSASLKLSSIGDGTEETIFNKLFKLDASSVGQFMATPVKLTKEIINPVKNYGTGIAPFFSCVTFWVAGFVLIALVKTEVDPPKRRKISPKQAYISRGMVYSVIAILQGAVCNIGELIIGIGCENPVVFVLTGAFASFVFVNIIYMLAACFKHVGKALSVVFIVMQIPGSSGMYPIEVMPSIFQAIHPFMPFTYAIEAMRQTIVNIDYVYWGYCILILLIMWAVAMFLGVFARRALANLNMLFDRMLADTDLIECETKDHIVVDSTQPIEQIANAIASSDEYSEKLDRTIEEFEATYKPRSRAGVIAMAIIPMLFLVVLCVVFKFFDFDINAKIIFMFIWLLLLVACAIYIIVIEFMHVRFLRMSQRKDKPVDTKDFANTVKNEWIDYA